MSRRIPPHLLAATAAPLLVPEWDAGAYDDILTALRLRGTTDAVRDWDALIPARFVNDLPSCHGRTIGQEPAPTIPIEPPQPPPRQRILGAELVDGWSLLRILRVPEMHRACDWNRGFYRDILRDAVAREAFELCPDDMRLAQVRIQPTGDPKAYRWLARYELRSV